MGVEQSVTFAETVPTWPAVRALLANLNYPVQMRMIEGQLAFPDEEPPADWREIRLGTPGGMVTVLREPRRVTFVVWGNADAGMIRGRNALIWAFAEAGSGQVDGQQSPSDFRTSADLPDGFPSH
jgi:hypothetical protein